MSRSTIVMAASLLGLSLAGCSFHARDAESYRKVTREVLETRNGDIKACYDKELEKDPKASGTVIVQFKVEKDTGVITDPGVQKESTAPRSVAKCVANALDGLKIDPPDAREGKATFTWNLEPKS
jgi:hypothetical protein